MKNTIIGTLTALSLSVSAASFASVNNDEVQYLFGTQEVVEMQVISDAEMQATEGQLFGMTFEVIGGYVDQAVVIVNQALDVVKPILAVAKPHLNEAYQGVKDAAILAIGTRLTLLLGGL